MRWKEKAKRLKENVYVLYLALGDRRTPWYAKVLLVVIIAYAVSPVDLIPDFIPVLGYVDDLVLIPAGIWLALKLVPREVLDEKRLKAKSLVIFPRAKWIVAIIIVLIWFLVIYLIIRTIWF
jgi:uncharacterized membrane protein YkvA (DUF1232 family)